MMMSCPMACYRSSFHACDVDRENRGAVFVEYDAVAADTQSITVPAGKTLYISTTADGVSDQTFGNLLADIRLQVIEIASRRY
ncbi:hypothetical protein [Mesorhizobium sp. M0243]|uniref:hypothetical protein n=1 Tax=unclassified Mesorhizobium TaxID=325217 RepID=UPI00333C64B3